jgi:hypothetical protein
MNTKSSSNTVLKRVNVSVMYSTAYVHAFFTPPGTNGEWTSDWVHMYVRTVGAPAHLVVWERGLDEP